MPEPGPLSLGAGGGRIRALRALKEGDAAWEELGVLLPLSPEERMLVLEMLQQSDPASTPRRGRCYLEVLGVEAGEVWLLWKAGLDVESRNLLLGLVDERTCVELLIDTWRYDSGSGGRGAHWPAEIRYSAPMCFARRRAGTLPASPRRRALERRCYQLLVALGGRSELWGAGALIEGAEALAEIDDALAEVVCALASGEERGGLRSWDERIAEGRRLLAT